MTRPIDTPLYPRRPVRSRRADVEHVLTMHPEYSDRRIARIAVVCREMVRDIRAELIRTCQIQGRYALRRVGADGKTYKRLPRPKSDRLTDMHVNHQP